ncbi:hypothetical protein ACFQY0_05240 [Haloferula chungangensis]|uniref:Uncharacterized protein n=1 Tax=Haloferula chungangensis TaxID=1048331 RepID=A0ABW2L508_9BACT
MNEESETAKPRRSRWVVAMLVILPFWLFVSALLGLWKYHHDSKKEEVFEPSKFTTPIEAERLADDMRKLVEIVGPRNVSSDDGKRGLKRAASMVQGALGAGNAGYRVELEKGVGEAGFEWPVIVATLPGGSGQALWVVTGYDTLGSGVEANSSGVVSVLAVARALAGEKPLRPIKFAFLPHAYDPEAPVVELLDQFSASMGKPDLVLVVESMGAKGELLVSSRELEVLKRPEFEKWATIVGAEAICLEEDFDLASTLFELNQPAVRVATRRVVSAGEADDRMPDRLQHAAATKVLAELVMDLAR